MSNDFNLTITLHIEGRNSRQLLMRLIGGLVTLAVLGARVMLWFTAQGN